MIQTWSLESTDTPTAEPITQPFGNGFGHSGSTSKLGAIRSAAAAVVGPTSVGLSQAASVRQVREIPTSVIDRFMTSSPNRPADSARDSNVAGHTSPLFPNCSGNGSLRQASPSEMAKRVRKFTQCKSRRVCAACAARVRRRCKASLALLALLGLPGCAALDAHEIPSDVTVRMIVHPAGETLSVLVRVPLEAMQDMNFPTLGPGYLDIARADAELESAAQRWLADSLEIYADGTRLPRPRLVAVRASIPSNRAFDAFAAARAHILGPRLPDTTQLIWRQALLDVLFELPIASERSALAVSPRFERLGLDVTTVIRYEAPSGETRMFQIDGAPELIELDPRWHQAAWRFVVQGFEHILGGTDHLLFLLCLVLPFRREVRELVWIVSAFTVAHSLTLIGSAFGLAPDRLWFTPMIEVLIAASIFYMAVENVIAPNARMRRVIAFVFGLVHGFGFSFALRNTLQFAGDHVLMSLLSFNIGVELGQLLVLAALIPTLYLVFRYLVRERVGVVLVSVLVAHTAWHWLGERYAVLQQFESF
jgi:hypothetical protein